MSIAAGRITALFFLLLSTCVPSRVMGDVVTLGSLDVTSGQLVMDPTSGPTNAFSLRGAGFTASGLLQNSSFFPQRCFVFDVGPAACVPGHYQFAEQWWSTGQGGTSDSFAEISEWQVSLNGTEYAGELQLAINAGALLPEFGDAATIVLTTPFNLGGSIVYASGDDVFFRNVRGRGTASLWLSRELNAHGTSVWQLERARYDINPAGPIPEPATLLLLGGGLTGIVVRRVIRRH